MLTDFDRKISMLSFMLYLERCLVGRRVFAGFVFLAVSACSALDGRTPEEVVADRAQERLDTLMKGDYEASYQFTTPGYRSTEGPGRYGTRWAGVGMWLSAEVKSVKCTGDEQVDRCRVGVEVLYKAVRFDPTTTFLAEDWLLINNNWYLYQNLAE